MRSCLKTIEYENCSDDLVNYLESCYKKKSANFSSYYLAKNLDLSIKHPIQQVIKRVFDFILAGSIILTGLPVFLLIGMAIKLESKGPILFKQKRIGQFGKKFYIYKFRSMCNDAEKQLKHIQKFNETNELMFKMFNDPRVTKLGKFMRKFSIDEFPQLINVIKGEMSLVGFRPPIPAEVEKYEEWHYVRFASMPGLTGPWQVSGRSGITSFDKVINLEFDYVKNWNLLSDLKILLKTIPAVFCGKGAA